MQAQELVLRDVHVPDAPALWPPAPGWWLVALGLVLVAASLWWWRHRRRRRLQSWLNLFDAQASQPSTAARIAAMSELLRRAARRVDAKASRLEGEAWLAFLDGGKPRGFVEGAGRLLLEGGYRRDVPTAEFVAVEALARARFIELMAGRK